MPTENGAPAGPIERKLELWAEIERLEAKEKRGVSKLTRAFMPALLFACLGPFVLDLPIWVFLVVALVLAVGGPGLLFIVDADMRGGRERWHRIQRLKREVSLLEALGDLTEDERAMLDLS